LEEKKEFERFKTGLKKEELGVEHKQKLERIRKEAGRKTEVELQKAIRDASREGLKRYDKQVLEGVIENTPDKFKQFLEDHIQASVHQKFPTIKTEVEEKRGKLSKLTGDLIKTRVKKESKRRTGKFEKLPTLNATGKADTQKRLEELIARAEKRLGKALTEEQKAKLKQRAGL
jgi:hypothetical protein